MKGFFDEDELTDKMNPGPTRGCPSCGLDKRVQSPKMDAIGAARRGLLNYGEAPGEFEDQKGKPWQGRAGRKLKSGYSRVGIDLWKDCVNINAVRCRPIGTDGSNRPPTPNEIAICRNRNLEDIQSYKPKVIALFGEKAIESFIGYRWKKDLGKIRRWRGWAIPDRDFGCWVIPANHPSYINREMEKRDSPAEIIWMQDLQKIVDHLDKPFPKFQDEKKMVRIITDLDQIPDLQSPFAFDYETTGLKPQNTNDHDIICGSICDRKNIAWAFVMTDLIRRQFRKILMNRRYKKIAQNAKFEDTWSKVILNCDVRGWLWDTQLSTHVLDNRSGVTGLKFQVFVNFGIPDYDSKIEKYLKAIDPRNGNSVNRIRELIAKPGGMEDLLIYCGMDSLFERRLAFDHMKKLGKEL